VPPITETSIAVQRTGRVLRTLLYPCAVPQWLTNAIELAEGAVCLGGSAIAWRRHELRAFAVLFALAGIAALGHAVGMIANG